MGLSTKQASGDPGLDWSQALLQSGTVELPKPPTVRRQQQQPRQQQSEPLKCPRCGSTNTKFCYYNNYNKSQPRHFCKACKRHWTKGGTLRNVPVGGGRKNKRHKTSNATAAAAATTTISTSTTATITTSSCNSLMGVQSQQQFCNLPMPLGDEKNLPDILYESLIRPPSLPQHGTVNSFTGKNFIGNNSTFMGSSLSVPQNQSLQVSFSSLNSFATNPSSIATSLQSLDTYSHTGKLETTEDLPINTTISTRSNIFSQPWQVPATSVAIDAPSYLNWNDIDTFGSADLNLPWDDTEIKPLWK